MSDKLLLFTITILHYHNLHYSAAQVQSNMLAAIDPYFSHAQSFNHCDPYYNVK